jgi:hypothetical protein
MLVGIETSSDAIAKCAAALHLLDRIHPHYFRNRDRGEACRRK